MLQYGYPCITAVNQRMYATIHETYNTFFTVDAQISIFLFINLYTIGTQEIPKSVSFWKCYKDFLLPSKFWHTSYNEK